MATKITGKPDKGVTNLSLARESGTQKMKATWKVPNDLVKDSNSKRATGLDVKWSLSIEDRVPHTVLIDRGNIKELINIPNRSTIEVKSVKNEKATSAEINLNNFKVVNGSSTKTYTRASFFPDTTKMIKSVTAYVTPHNSKGNGKSQHITKTFKTPATPTIDAPTFNTTGGTVSTTIRRVDGTLYQEQRDVFVVRTVYSSVTGNTSVVEDTFTSATKADSYSYSYFATLNNTNYVKVKWDAYARGYAGFSKTSSRTYYISRPAQATITSTKVSARDATGQVTVKLKTNSTTEHPVDIVTLEYLANVTYATAASIDPNEVWTDAGVSDNGKCPAMTISVSGLVPDAGKHTWVRVKTARANAENILYRYSDFVELKELYTPAPSAADDYVTIISAVAGDDGKSIKALLGWNADGNDDSTGTELSWSEDENAWRSTDEPDTFTFTWSDGRYPATGTRQYYDSATVYIKGLEEAETYNIKARRYMDKGDDGIEYGAYSNAKTCIPHKVPVSVFPVCDRYVPSGSPLSVRWTIAGATMQTAWRIKTSTRVIASGEGSVGSTQISASRLKEVAVSNQVTFTVEVSTGSKYVASEERTVTIIDKPTLSLTVPATMTAQSSFSITATSNRISDLVVIVTSQGASSQTPLGLVRQTDGDTIYSDKLYPTWTSENNTYSTTITFPTDLDFWDLGNYTVTVTAIDRQTNLTSDTKEATFAVNWTNKAVSPVSLTYSATADTLVDQTKAYYEYDSEQDTYNLVTPVGDEDPSDEGWYTQTETNAVTLKVIDKVVDDEHIQAVQINLTPPTNSQSTDLYDIYRMDVDHPTLIGEGFPLTYTAVDEYAPFGSDVDLFYRIALRTVDGDVAFTDIPYTAENESMRFDWAEGTLELPYGITLGDSYSKDFEKRHHLDGSTDGYWNPNIDRKSSLSSSVIKLIQPDEIRKARQLGRYAGAVFVRLPDGSAYEANVEVTDLSRKNEAITQIAIDAEEIGATEEFMLPIPTTLGE